MSNLQVDNINGQNADAGTIKAWAKFAPNSNGATSGSLNVSSVSDEGTGLFRVNYTSSFLNSDNAPVGSAGLDSTAPGEIYTIGAAEGNFTGQTATSHLAQINDDGVLADTNPCFCHVIGNLAP